LTRLLGGPELFAKCDDESGSDLSGNKVRKLEFLLAEACAQGADIVLTCGAVASNHCRATALAARRLGMDSLLFLRGQDPGARDGNLLLDVLAGAELRFITPEQYADRARGMAAAAEDLRAAGRRPYVIPEGGSNAVGALGYLACVEEIVAQDPGWDHLVVAIGSGGTLAGLLLGAARSRFGARIWGVNVCDSPEYFTGRVREIVSEFAGRFPALAAEIRAATGRAAGEELIAAESIRILDGYKAPGYGLPSPAALEWIRAAARADALLLDPVYTGKAFHALVEETRRGRFRTGERVLFLHTGGIFSLFPFREALTPPVG
jgi:D-cysteine desulfhydrase